MSSQRESKIYVNGSLIGTHPPPDIAVAVGGPWEVQEHGSELRTVESGTVADVQRPPCEVERADRDGPERVRQRHPEDRRLATGLGERSGWVVRERRAAVGARDVGVDGPGSACSESATFDITTHPPESRGRCLLNSR